MEPLCRLAQDGLEAEQTSETSDESETSGRAGQEAGSKT